MLQYWALWNAAAQRDVAGYLQVLSSLGYEPTAVPQPTLPPGETFGPRETPGPQYECE